MRLFFCLVLTILSVKSLLSSSPDVDTFYICLGVVLPFIAGLLITDIFLPKHYNLPQDKIEYLTKVNDLLTDYEHHCISFGNREQAAKVRAAQRFIDNLTSSENIL